ncbi:MAG: branched-chain amino acid ABC transporter permease [Caldilineaceae bacterium]|nr:branched-chain amino acid ABC transporter permease [Caldilineaceae bacterium]
MAFPFLHEWPFFRLFLGEYRTFNATMFAVWLLVLLGMNLLTGYSGQVSFGHAALVLASAYLTAVLSQQYGFPLWGAIGLSGAATAIVGWVTIGIPAVRLRGPYLAIATFGLMLAFPQILKLNVLTQWTQGALGIRGGVVEPPGFLGDVLDGREWMYYVAMSMAVVMTVLFLNLTRSRTGRAFVALRDSEVGAEQMGVDVPKYKALAFGVSSLYAGIGGGLFFAVQGFVSPDSLGLIDSIFFLVAIVIGGLGSVLGSIVGALFLTFQSEAISALAGFVPGANNLRNVFYGASLIAVIVLFPKGIAGFFQRPLWPKLRGWNLGRLWSSRS